MGWVGIPEFKAAAEKLAKQADVASRMILVQSASLVVRNAQENFVGSHRRNKPHVGGSKPNVVTGQTRRSIKFEGVVRVGLATYMTRVGPTVAWGRRLELGMNGKGAYPYFGPAVEKSRIQFPSIASSAWGAAMH
jgi:hypothetical protein